jgi:hypothetical protein
MKEFDDINKDDCFVDVPSTFFKCTHGVFSKTANGSLCYTDSEERGRFIAEKINEACRLKKLNQEMLEVLSEIIRSEYCIKWVSSDTWQCESCLGIKGHTKDCIVPKARSLIERAEE